MDWFKAAEARKDELIRELQELIQIESVLDEEAATEQAPFGPGPLAALNWLLAKGKEQGMTTKIIDNMAGHIEMGEGDELLGILCHVDVVPAGDEKNWQYPPFKGVIENGKLFGRGAIDDKGPTMAAWLAMKLIKDTGIPLTKRVRMIIGSDEESGFRCVNRYFEKEEMPTIGFAPDADFPLINAEKGIALLGFHQKTKIQEDEQLISFKAGKRSNMVPDLAEAVVRNVSDDIVDQLQAYLQTIPYAGSLINTGSEYKITIQGKSAHAMEPEKGVNAAVLLAEFLQHILSSKAGQEFVQFMVEVFSSNHLGTAIGLNYADHMSGETTLNAGVVTFDHEHRGEILVSMRYSVTYPFDEKITAAQKQLASSPFTLDVQSDSKPHYVSADDELVQTLESVYRSYTNDQTTPLLSTGGGTYARVMKKGVAFGMLFPGEPDVAHQANEFVVVENLVKAAAIYAEAIVRLAGE